MWICQIWLIRSYWFALKTFIFPSHFTVNLGLLGSAFAIFWFTSWINVFVSLLGSSGSNWIWSVAGNGIASVWQRGGTVMKWEACTLRARDFKGQPPTSQDTLRLAYHLCLFFFLNVGMCAYDYMCLCSHSRWTLTCLLFLLTVRKTGSHEFVFANFH